jgi:hypothetical protein
MEPYRDKRRHLPAIGLGRNCTLFEVTRRFGYTHRRVCPERELFEGIYGYAGHYNESRFQNPLPLSEVRATARSVTKWVIRWMDDEGFVDWCHRRARYGNKKSQEIRTAKAEERAAQIRAYQQEHPDVTREELSTIFDVSEFTLKGLSLGMAETRKQARKTKAASRAEEIRAYKAEHPYTSVRELAKVFHCSIGSISNYLNGCT